MSDPRKRVHTLLTDRAAAGLDAHGRAELDHLLVGAAIDPSYEAAAAAIELALMAHTAAIPEPVNAAVLRQAADYWGFADRRVHEPSPQAARSLPELRFPDEDDDALFGDEMLLGDPESSAVQEQLWETQHGPFESLEDAIESGVLESSLTNGRVDRSAKPEDSQRSALPPDLERLRERASRQPEPELESRDDLTSPSKSDVGPSLSQSQVVHLPVSESRLARWLTYVSAAAALIMVAIALWLYTHRDDPRDAEDVLAEVEAADDTIEWSFEVKADPAVREGAQGTVSWSSKLQSGVLELRGLAVNDPTESQYQLWIVDKTREGPSVDGGVFDVSSEDEVEVAIDAKLLVGQPSAFVITIERPGGVVVSEQSRVVMVATGA